MTIGYLVTYDVPLSGRSIARTVLREAGWSEWIPDAAGMQFQLPHSTLLREFPSETTAEKAYESFALALVRAGVVFDRGVVMLAQGAVYKSDRKLTCDLSLARSSARSEPPIRRSAIRLRERFRSRSESKSTRLVYQWE